MAERNRPPGPKIPVLLATPLTAENQEFADYLRALVVLGVIDLRVPSFDPPAQVLGINESLFYIHKQSEPIPASFYGGATVVQAQTPEEFLSTVDREMAITERKAVVVYGSATKEKEKIHKGVEIDIALRILGESEGHTRVISDKKVPIPQTLVLFPEFSDDLKWIKARVFPVMDMKPNPMHIHTAVKVIIDAFPTNSLPEEARLRNLARKRSAFILDRNQDQIFILNEELTHVVQSMPLQEFERQLRAVLVQEMAGQFLSEYVSEGRKDVVDTRFFTDTDRNIWIDDPITMVEGFRTAVKRIGYEWLPHLDAVLRDVEPLLQLQDVQARDAALIALFQADAQAVRRIGELTKDYHVHAKAKVRGRSKCKNDIQALVDIAVSARKTIDAITSQYAQRGDIGSLQVPYRDALRLLSAVIVHRAARDELIELTQSEFVQHILHSQSDQTRELLPPIDDKAFARLVINVAVKLEGHDVAPEVRIQNAELLDELCRVHNKGFGFLKEIAEHSELVRESHAEINAVDVHTRTPSQEAAELVRNLQLDQPQYRPDSAIR